MGRAASDDWESWADAVGAKVAAGQGVLEEATEVQEARAAVPSAAVEPECMVAPHVLVRALALAACHRRHR